MGSTTTKEIKGTLSNLKQLAMKQISIKQEEEKALNSLLLSFLQQGKSESTHFNHIRKILIVEMEEELLKLLDLRLHLSYLTVDSPNGTKTNHIKAALFLLSYLKYSNILTQSLIIEYDKLSKLVIEVEGEEFWKEYSFICKDKVANKLIKRFKKIKDNEVSISELEDKLQVFVKRNGTIMVDLNDIEDLYHDTEFFKDSNLNPSKDLDGGNNLDESVIKEITEAENDYDNEKPVQYNLLNPGYNSPLSKGKDLKTKKTYVSSSIKHRSKSPGIGQSQLLFKAANVNLKVIENDSAKKSGSIQRKNSFTDETKIANPVILNKVMINYRVMFNNISKDSINIRKSLNFNNTSSQKPVPSFVKSVFHELNKARENPQLYQSKILRMKVKLLTSDMINIVGYDGSAMTIQNPNTPVEIEEIFKFYDKIVENSKTNRLKPLIWEETLYNIEKKGIKPTDKLYSNEVSNLIRAPQNLKVYKCSEVFSLDWVILLVMLNRMFIKDMFGDMHKYICLNSFKNDETNKYELFWVFLS